MGKLENISNLFPHNKKVFLKVLENLKTHNKVGVVQATGTGKGKLAACFVEYLLSRKKSAKILIAAPLRSVLENYRDNFNITSDSVKYATYSKINNLSEIDLINIGQQYDLIVLDEYHRCGAPEWFKSIQALFNGVDKGVCKVIGLTATPIRYLDNSRDMSEELFNGNVIEGLNLEEAILDGILPGFVYNACYFGTEKVLKEVEDKLKNNDYKISDDTIRNDLMVKVKELNMIYQNRYKIENIIKDNTKELGINQKWVIFCRDKQSLGEIREFCVNWFNYKPNLYIINSDRQAEDNDRTLVEFRNAKQGINVMLCVDMLNEGVHIKDLNGVIMLRKTDSPIIFLQQLGRSLEAGKDFKPIIFDLIGNYKGLKVKQNEIERTPISIVKGIEKKTKGKSNYVIVHNFTEDFDKVMDEISVIAIDYFWSPEEIEIIKKYYPLGGADLCIENGLKRKRSTIKSKAIKIGLKYDAHYWSEEDFKILRTYYPLGGAKLCQERGLNRGIYGIKSKAQELGIKSEVGVWTDKEIEILKEFYPLGGVKLCQEKGLDKTDNSISTMAGRYGVKADYKEVWTEEDIMLLKKYYPIGGWELCQKKCSGNKPMSSIITMASRYDVKAEYMGAWSEKELNLLKESYPLGGSLVYVEKAKKLGFPERTHQSIRQKAARLGLNVVQKRWSKEENEFIRQNYKKKGAKWCKENGLNNWSIEMIEIQARNLEDNGEYKQNWSTEELNILRKYFPLGGAELCIKNGIKNRTLAAINTKANKCCLFFSNNDLPAKWTEEELDILRKYFPLGGAELCQEKGLQDRTIAGIRVKANRLGLTYRKL